MRTTTSVPFAAPTEKPQPADSERSPNAELQPPLLAGPEPVEETDATAVELEPSAHLPAVESADEPESRFKNDTMARLWQDAADPETGADAIAKLRARQQLRTEERGGGWQRFRRSRS